MGKLYGILFLLLILVIETNGQLRPPVQPLKENGYTNQEFSAFAKKETKLSASYRYELLKLMNKFLRETGLAFELNGGAPLTIENIDYIFGPEHTWTEDRVYPDGFWNTRIGTDGKIEWFWDKEYFRGPVQVFHFGGYELDLGKEVCTNLVNVPYKKVKTTEQKIVEQNYSQGNSQRVVRDEVATGFPKDLGQAVLNMKTKPETSVFPEQRLTWFGKNYKWFIPVAATAVAIGTGFIAHDKNHYWYVWFPKGGPIDAPPVGGDEGGPQDGQPVGP